jgi:hypothetical protein
MFLPCYYIVIIENRPKRPGLETGMLLVVIQRIRRRRYAGFPAQKYMFCGKNIKFRCFYHFIVLKSLKTGVNSRN